MLSKDDTYRKIFANNLNYYMQVNNKIQDDLVKDLGLKTSTISSWCNGQKLHIPFHMHYNEYIFQN